jgi:transcription elongation factor GreA
VTVFNVKTKKELVWTLVGPAEADMAKGKISTASPVGQAILGRAVGDKTKATVPAGDLVLEIRGIAY